MNSLTNFLLLFLLTLFRAVKETLSAPETLCSNPLLSETLNIWAPLESFDSPQTVQGLNICKNLEGKQACCSQSTINDYKRQWYNFKEYFEQENARQVDVHNERVIFALENKENFKTSVREMRSLINSAEDVYDGLIKALDENSVDELNDKIPNRLNVDVSKINLPEWLKPVEKTLKDNSDIMNSTYETVVKYLKEQQTIDYLQNIKGDKNIRVDNFDFLRSPLNVDDIEEEIQQAQVRLRRFVQEREKCLTATSRHFASVMCVICDASNQGFSKLGNKIMLNLSTSTCSSLLDSCYNYLDSEIELNKNMIFAANIDSYNKIYSTIGNNFNVKDITAITNFLDMRLQSMRESMQSMVFYRMPTNCTDSRNCVFICKEFINSIGINASQVLNGTVLDTLPLDTGMIENGVDIMMKYINGNFRRRLQVKGSSDINLSSYQSPDNSIHYGDYFEFNSYQFAERTGVDFSITGTGRIRVFNLTGNMTLSDLKSFTDEPLLLSFSQATDVYLTFMLLIFVFLLS